MAKKDYYLMLGVPRSESHTGIRSAFRELAKKHHPDLVGSEAARSFHEIREAYEVLSDPERRRLYNHSLREAEPASELDPPEPIIPHDRPKAEPLIPEPMSVLRGFQTIQPSFDPFFERVFRNFSEIGIPKGERLEGLNVEIVLSPEEAAHGMVAPIGVPVFYTCSLCDGSGRDWLFPCIECRGQGMVEGEKTVSIRIPPLVRDHTIIEVPLHGLGIHNLWLRLHIRIGR